jgi:predicted acylesterase/phospholipase RssA
MNHTVAGKTALVLAGGGITGAVFEIGALRAIDDLLLDRTVNDFDVFVGTSAGALIASLLVNGFSPEEMFQIIEGSNIDIEPLQPKHIFGINYRDILELSYRVPRTLFDTWLQYIRHQSEMTFFDIMWSVSEMLPTGLYDSLTLEKYVRQILVNFGQSNNFTNIDKDLHIIATDLDNGERVVFSKGSNCEVPISLAVAASSAMPLVYKPIRIGSHEYVDGGLRGNASLDLAIEHGASLIVCINPMVPYESTDKSSPTVSRDFSEHLSDKGIQSIANQTLRISSHASLHYHIKQLRRAHPQVDIIIIEPRQKDFRAFSENIMNFSARLEVARYGFESATLDLAEEYHIYKQILVRHGILISRRLVSEELWNIQESNYDPNVIWDILEARSSACGRRRRNTPVCQLTRTLAELEYALDSIEL